MQLEHKKYHKHTPREDTMAASTWRDYVQSHRVGAPYHSQFTRRFRVVATAVRMAIITVVRMNEVEQEQYIRKFEGWADLMFTDGDPGVNKARLRVSFRISFLLQMLMGEISYFVATGKILKHKKHLTQDGGR